MTQPNFSREELTALQTVFDQLCSDHFVEEGKPPYDFEDEEKGFISILGKVEESLEKK